MSKEVKNSESFLNRKVILFRSLSINNFGLLKDQRSYDTSGFDALSVTRKVIKQQEGFEKSVTTREINNMHSQNTHVASIFIKELLLNVIVLLVSKSNVRACKDATEGETKTTEAKQLFCNELQSVLKLGRNDWSESFVTNLKSQN